MKRNFLSLFIGSIFLISSSVAMADHHLAGEKTSLILQLQLAALAL